MRKRRNAELDLTPLIDVVFILLIFFVLTSTFKKKEYLMDLNLPSAESGAIVSEDIETIDIDLSEEALAVGGKEVSFEELDKYLHDFRGKTVPVHTRIDKAVRYERVVRVLDIFTSNELTNIVLVTEEKK